MGISFCRFFQMQKSGSSQIIDCRNIMENIIDCPALHEKSKLYPFGDRVPKKVKMLKTAMSDPVPLFMQLHKREPIKPLVASCDSTLDCWTNKHGAVAVLINGEKLGVKPDEFEIIEWH